MQGKTYLRFRWQMVWTAAGIRSIAEQRIPDGATSLSASRREIRNAKGLRWLPPLRSLYLLRHPTLRDENRGSMFRRLSCSMKTGHLRRTGSVDSEQRANANAADESRDGGSAESKHTVDFGALLCLIWGWLEFATQRFEKLSAGVFGFDRNVRCCCPSLLSRRRIFQSRFLALALGPRKSLP